MAQVASSSSKKFCFLFFRAAADAREVTGSKYLFFTVSSGGGSGAVGYDPHGPKVENPGVVVIVENAPPNEFENEFKENMVLNGVIVEMVSSGA